MPDYTVSADVDSMLRSANDAAIRSAIGVGTTDAPTFLAQTLTGQSLTGTQATSLVDLSATWNTTGIIQTAIKLNVTDTASNAASNLMDLQVDGQSKFNVSKGGEFSFRSGSNFASISTDGTGRILLNSSTSAGARVVGDLLIGSNDVVLVRDSAPGILAQRNGVNAQAFRVYNTFLGTTANEWAELDWKTDGTLRLGTNQAGTGAIKSVNFVVGGTARWGISGTTNPLTTGHLLATEDNAYDIGAIGKNRPRIVYVARSVQAGSGNGGGFVFGAFGGVTSYANGVFTWWNQSVSDFGRFQLGGTTSAFPAIKRNGTGIDIVLANDSAFAPLTASALIAGTGLGGNSGLTFVSQTRIMSESDGVMFVSNNAFTDFNRLQLGGNADTHPAIARDGAGIKITGAATGLTSWIKVPAVAVASLPSAATAGVGARSFVNDALSPVFGSAVTGGGAVTVPVYSTGSAWNVG